MPEENSLQRLRCFVLEPIISFHPQQKMLHMPEQGELFLGRRNRNSCLE
jgi:hypothetical protein